MNEHISFLGGGRWTVLAAAFAVGAAGSACGASEPAGELHGLWVASTFDFDVELPVVHELTLGPSSMRLIWLGSIIFRADGTAELGSKTFQVEEAAFEGKPARWVVSQDGRLTITSDKVLTVTYEVLGDQLRLTDALENTVVFRRPSRMPVTAESLVRYHRFWVDGRLPGDSLLADACGHPPDSFLVFHDTGTVDVVRQFGDSSAELVCVGRPRWRLDGDQLTIELEGGAARYTVHPKAFGAFDLSAAGETLSVRPDSDSDWVNRWLEEAASVCFDVGVPPDGADCFRSGTGDQGARLYASREAEPCNAERAYPYGDAFGGDEVVTGARIIRPAERFTVTHVGYRTRFFPGACDPTTPHEIHLLAIRGDDIYTGPVVAAQAYAVDSADLSAPWYLWVELPEPFTVGADESLVAAIHSTNATNEDELCPILCDATDAVGRDTYINVLAGGDVVWATSGEAHPSGPVALDIEVEGF